MHLLGNQDCQIKIHNYAKPLWMAGATNRSARKRHSKRPKNNQRSFATSSITFSWSLVCTCIVPLFRSLMKAFVAWTSIPPCKKTGLQTLRLTPNLKLIHVSLVLTLVHGPTPPTVTTNSRWFERPREFAGCMASFVTQVLPCTCTSFCSELLANHIL